MGKFSDIVMCSWISLIRGFASQVMPILRMLLQPFQKKCVAKSVHSHDSLLAIGSCKALLMRMQQPVKFCFF